MGIAIRRKEKVKKVGSGIATFLMIVMILRINSYFMISESAAVTQAFKTGLRVMLTGICFLVYRLHTSSPDPVQFTYRNVEAFFLYNMYLLLGFASLLWTSELRYSTLQLTMDLECVFFVYYYWKIVVLLEQHPKYNFHVKLERILYISIALIAIAFIIGMFANPSKFYRGTHGGEVQRLGGFIINPNELGMLSVVGAGALYTELFRSKINFWKIVCLIMMTWCLVMTGSRSSMISFFGTTFFFVISSGNKYLLGGAVAAGAAAMPYILNKIFFKVGNAEEVMSMTGRLPFWKDLLNYAFPEKPWFGWGFMRIAYHDKFDSIHAYAAGMTHNTFVQVIINLGIVGALIVFFQMVVTFKALFRVKKEDTNKYYLFVGVFIPIFVNSTTEFGFWGETNYGIMWYLFLILLLVIDAKPGKSHKALHEVYKG